MPLQRPCARGVEVPLVKLGATNAHRGPLSYAARLDPRCLELQRFVDAQNLQATERNFSGWRHQLWRLLHSRHISDGCDRRFRAGGPSDAGSRHGIEESLDDTPRARRHAIRSCVRKNVSVVGGEDVLSPVRHHEVVRVTDRGHKTADDRPDCAERKAVQFGRDDAHAVVGGCCATRESISFGLFELIHDEVDPGGNAAMRPDEPGSVGDLEHRLDEVRRRLVTQRDHRPEKGSTDSAAALPETQGHLVEGHEDQPVNGHRHVESGQNDLKIDIHTWPHTHTHSPTYTLTYIHTCVHA